MGAVLPFLYPSVDPQSILEDSDSAPIPDLHKAMFRFVKKITQASWEMTAADIAALRAASVPDEEIVRWAQIASLQGWWTMSADGSGIPLEGDAITGPVLQKPREWYEGAAEGLTAAVPGATDATGSANSAGSTCWVETATDTAAFKEDAQQALERYGFVPGVLVAGSLRPEMGRRHLTALRLLEKPQTRDLSPRAHALVRARCTALNRSPYGAVTTRALLERVTGEAGLFERVQAPLQEADTWSDEEQVVLAFTDKLVRNAYKVTEKDAIAFREVGLSDEAYVDVLDTASIQTSLDRLANALGVAPDAEPCLAR